MKELHATNSVQSNAEMFGEAETLNSLRHPCIIAFYGVVVNQVPVHHLLYLLWLMPILYRLCLPDCPLNRSCLLDRTLYRSCLQVTYHFITGLTVCH